MTRVDHYVGRHQRMTGQIRKLPEAMAILRKREKHMGDCMELEELSAYQNVDCAVIDKLKIVEIVERKILCASWQELIGDGGDIICTILLVLDG